MADLKALGCWSCRYIENFRGRLICQLGHIVTERCEEFEYDPGSDEGERDSNDTEKTKPVCT